jgi:hypothetical protein
VNASVLDPPDPTDAVWVFPSQHLTVEVLRRPIESTLTAVVGVMHQPLQLGLSVPDGHLQGVQGQVGAQRPRDLPAHQEAAEGVDDQGDIDKPDQVAT